MADEALQQEAEQEELTEVELPESEENEEEELQEEEPQQEAKKESDEIEDYSEGVKKRIAKLTYKIREAERREQAAIDYAKSVQGELNKTKNKLSKTDQNLYDEYKGRVGSELQAAQDRYKKAYESGDTDAMLEAQKSIAKLAVEEESLNRVRAKQPEEVEEAVVDVDKEIQTRSQVQQEPQVQADPKAQDWAQDNKWFGTDKAMTYTAMSFHDELVNEGFDVSTDEYYTEIDRRIRKEFPHKFEDQSKPRQKVASATRTTATGRRTVKLTPSQVAIAKKLGVPLEEYAKHVKEA